MFKLVIQRKTIKSINKGKIIRMLLIKLMLKIQKIMNKTKINKVINKIINNNNRINNSRINNNLTSNNSKIMNNIMQIIWDSNYKDKNKMSKHRENKDNNS